jgi:hypothetical protein
MFGNKGHGLSAREERLRLEESARNLEGAKAFGEPMTKSWKTNDGEMHVVVVPFIDGEGHTREYSGACDKDK